jgi:DNA-directed RNA polymerase subunit H (RpoH/RPB5)
MQNYMKNHTKKWVLKESIKQAILKDPELHGKVVKALGIATVSLPKIVANNSQKLTQYGVLFAISKHLNRPQRDLLEEQELEAATA